MPIDHRQDDENDYEGSYAPPPAVPVPRFSYAPKRRKEDVPQTPYAFAAEMVRRHGPWAALCALLVYFMAGVLQRRVEDSQTTMNETLLELRQHSMDASYFMRQQCINTSVLAGTPKELCDPPSRPIGRP